MVEFRPQKKFPFYKRYKRHFPITQDTIFVYKDTIYSDNSLPYDILHHEIRHLQRQMEIGAKKWIDKYLEDSEFRLQEELIAYKYQLEKVIEMGDNEEYQAILHECCTNVSSPLYGNIINYSKALGALTKQDLCLTKTIGI